MMDHARHLSSPSPTSPFLFQHSDKSFKSSSNPLTPLLSSTVVADVNGVEDCFSTSSSNISHQNHPFGVDHQHHSLVDSHHHHHQQNHHHLNHHHHHHHHQRHTDQCMIDQDSLTGVDDDDGMHNMLSGSSTSSTSTMPLLTESHSHHSFTRISLEEYSPLSLVEDCDNALPISPTSLACGSHHSFKTSLNGLKMDNLVGDVEVHEDNDDVNDARSLSPTLLSTSNNNHHNLWSTSSTAITQNTSLLNSASTSFLLSHHHHHHQLNSLIQQLEPQSLNEPPPLLSNSSSFETNNSLAVVNRPSSEPPPASGAEAPDIESKSLNNQPLQSRSKQSNGKQSKFNTGNQSSMTSPSRPRKNRNRSGCNAATKQQASNSNNARDNKNTEIDKQKHHSNGVTTDLSSTNQQLKPVHCSKLHLQLNHHKKLQELQQRLFGNNATTTNVAIDHKDETMSVQTKTSSTFDHSTSSTSVLDQSGISAHIGIKEEPDSSAGSKDESNVSPQVSPISKTRTQTRNRKGNNVKAVLAYNSSSSTSPPKGNKKSITAETAEPDTTTKSSDCIKLADLLSGNSDNKNNNSFLVGGLTATSEAAESNNGSGEKRVQQFQLQVSPSLTVVANGELMQPIGIQQKQTSGTVITSSGSFTNQILCRPQTVVATTGGQLKAIMSNNDLLSGETMLTNWSLQSAGLNNQTSGNSNNNGTSAASLSNGRAIGAHQFAIQVICQDGTSLVLPVSSPAGLNAAVSLTSQHQQLQAVLANNANQQRNSSQLLPLMSVSNIVAQQQANGLENSVASNQNSSSQNLTQQATGLAASSPTLAALLDAGSNRKHGTIKANLESPKQSKIGSSTGNRQVDPTQPFRCEHCNSTFTRLGNFTRHKKIHTVPTKDGQRFKCDVCSKSFLQRCDLARHLHIHRGTEPHRCNICGKGYIRHSDLVTHQRFHNKEKPFGCPQCNKGFCQRGDLNRHLRSIHLQMKPILCPCCNRKFAKQETLLRHLNTAHRSKSGTNNAATAELPPNYTITQGDDKQTTISVVTNATIVNTNIAQKNAPVVSLQAI